ncbi:tetratricopeptide repeat protein [Caulobacter sp. 1776]|uniref:O-linked N-acetylglucosamine transferase, SPINDLY family protein n=1 Tax=Caulobacter sp. 1776 TaxID=3156420 RepID=UPI003399CDE2
MSTARDAFALYQAGRMAEAAALCERLVVEAPSVEAWHLLGVSRLGLNQAEAALVALEAGLALDAKRPGLLSARALALTTLARDEDAVVAAEAALVADAENPLVLNALGVSFRRLGHAEKALAAYDAALGVDPGFVDALCNRGIALTDLGRFDAALAAHDRAVRAAPRAAKALANRAALLSLLNRPAEAARDLEAVLELDPLHPRLAGDLMWARRQICDWSEDAALDMLVKADLKLGRPGVSPFAALALFDIPALHRRCAELTAPPAVAPVWPVRPPGERIRVAYLSSDLHEHATARLLAGVLEAHDRSRFEIFAVSYGPDLRGSMRERLKAAFEHWIEARNLSDAAVSALCRERGIDIAVDLKGYTQDGRPGILAHRAAPVQVSWLGYPGTLGAHADIVIADAVTLPPGAESDWSEAVARLPLYQPNDALGPALPPPSRAEAGLPDDAFVFCCFNNPAKITPDTFAAWMAILKAAPGGVLWLYAGAPGAADNLRAHAVQARVAPERLVFAEPTPHAQHLARHALADLVLDTWPYGAHTTASDALRMAIPVLTLPGASFASRVGASLLTALDLPDLIASTQADYVAKAVGLAADPAALAALKARLSEALKTSAVFDPTAFARSLEAAFAGIAVR